MIPKVKVDETDNEYLVTVEISKANIFAKHLVDYIRSLERTPASPIDPEFEARL